MEFASFFLRNRHNVDHALNFDCVVCKVLMIWSLIPEEKTVQLPFKQKNVNPRYIKLTFLHNEL